MKRNVQLKYPILYGVLAIVFTTAIIVAWNIMFTQYYVLATETQVSELGVGFWLILSLGDTFLLIVVLILIFFLVGSIRHVLYVRRQNAFVDSVTHELVTPLAGLRLCVDSLEKREMNKEKQDYFLSMMSTDIYRLESFIGHLLQTGQLEHGVRVFSYEMTDVMEIIRRCRVEVCRRYKLEESCIKIPEMQISTLINTDSVAFETIVNNLLDNAIKYSGASPRVVVSIINSGETFLMEVRDSGVGIPKRHLKKVFKRFHRIRHLGLPAIRGTGLGLYLVKALVTEMGGRIKGESLGEGKGATFTLTLPIHSKGRETAEQNRAKSVPIVSNQASSSRDLL
jgi:hypothetical protein